MAKIAHKIWTPFFDGKCSTKNLKTNLGKFYVPTPPCAYERLKRIKKTERYTWDYNSGIFCLRTDYHWYAITYTKYYEWLTIFNCFLLLGYLFRIFVNLDQQFFKCFVRVRISEIQYIWDLLSFRHVWIIFAVFVGCGN